MYWFKIKKIISFLISHLCVATINYYMVYSQVYKWMIIFSSYPTAIVWIFPEKITIDDRTVCLFYQLFIVLYFITLICLVQTDWLSSLILWYEWSSQIDFKKQLSVFARQVSKTMHFSDQNNYKNMVNKNITKENINYIPIKLYYKKSKLEICSLNLKQLETTSLRKIIVTHVNR